MCSIWTLAWFGVSACIHHDAWDDTHLLYSVYLAELLKRSEYYGIAANVRAEVVDTLEDCSE